MVVKDWGRWRGVDGECSIDVEFQIYKMSSKDEWWRWLQSNVFIPLNCTLDMNLSKLWEIVEDQGPWWAAASQCQTRLSY